MTEYDFDRTARLWLDDGPSQMPDRALDAALATIGRTRQRRAFWPASRFPFMTPTLRVAASAAAVIALVVGVVAIGLGPSGPGAIQVTPTPTPSASPSPLVIPAGEGRVLLTPGTYLAASPFPKRVTVTLPDGWSGNIGGPYAVFLSRLVPNAEIDLSIFTTVYADPCHYDRGAMNPPPGPSVDDLVTALTNLPGMTVTPVTDVTIAGYHGRQFTMTAPATTDGCTLPPGAGFRIWELPLGATNDMDPGQREQVTVLDVDGTRIVLTVMGFEGATTTPTPEVQGIVNSIRIEPGG